MNEPPTEPPPFAPAVEARIRAIIREELAARTVLSIPPQPAVPLPAHFLAELRRAMLADIRANGGTAESFWGAPTTGSGLRLANLMTPIAESLLDQRAAQTGSAGTPAPVPEDHSPADATEDTPARQS